MQLGPQVCQDLEAALRREWLETDGQGGFAAGTVAGANTRRYHGALVSAVHPPVGRRVLVARLEERLRLGPDYTPLSVSLFPGVAHPQGHRHLEQFRLDPWPTWTWRVGSVVLEKALFMPHRRRATVVRYHLQEAPEAVWLLIRPLLAGRDYHHLARASTEFRTGLVCGSDRFRLQPWEGDSAVSLIHPGGELWADGLWYYNFHYPREQERGLDCTEDLYSPGEIAFLLTPGESCCVIATPEADLEPQPETWAAQERERRVALQQARPEADAVGRRLALAADRFLVQRRVEEQDLLSIIAGYPWFTDWGRDAMIALPGLTLALGRVEEAQRVLRAFAAHLRGGLLPNTFDDTGQGAHYNTVDASLWFVQAVGLLAEQPGGRERVADGLYQAVLQILDCYRQGTDFGIGADSDGLIRAGSPDTQLTWMDAKCGETVFTPRHGKPVEINALWCHGLEVGRRLAEALDSPQRAEELAGYADQARRSFAAFWDEQRGWLCDVLTDQGPDPTLRPNQVIALALQPALLPEEQARRALGAVTEHLLTPYGLRTLAPFEPGYRGQYGGDQYQRDSAYHQGTVWPWLLGPYVSAYLRLAGEDQESRRHARGLLQPLVEHLDDVGLGSLSEVFSGDPPHAPGGCPAQAWSVAEALRCWTQYRLDEV